MCDKLIRTKFVYHYTSLEAIFALLHGYHRNGNYLSFRASNIYKVNDPNEMVSGFNVIKDIILKYELQNQVPEEKRLSEIYNTLIYEDECKRDYLYGKGKEEVNHGIIPYVISFSKHRDYLPMWSLYGKKGKGVCLKFDLSCLTNNMENCLDGFVYYDKRNNSVINEYDINFLYDLYLRQYSNVDKVPIDRRIFELGTICFALSPFFKHKDYMYEGEFRIVYNRSYTKQLSSRSSFLDAKSRIEPFVPINIPIDSLKEIIIGPNADYDVMSHILSIELKECGISSKIITQSKINFKHNK